MANARSLLGVVIAAALAAAGLAGCGSDNESDQIAKQEEPRRERADARRQAQQEKLIEDFERRMRESEQSPPGSSAPEAPSEPAPGSASASGSRCAAGALRAVSSGGQGAAGTQFASLRFELRGPGRCTLSGYPGVTLLDAGRQLRADVGRFSTGRLRTVVVDARHPAHFDLVYRVTGLAERPCRTRVSDLRIIPPDDRRALPVRLRPGPLTLCLDSVRVGAVRATSALAGG